jgi:hypothetical protein
MSDQRQHPARHLVLAVVLGLGALALGAGPALAQPLQCGATVTQDTTLAADLLECQGDGLVVGADGITVDLNGHTISGRIISGGDPDQVGIENPGHDDVTITNGTVSFFAGGGVHLAPGQDGARVDRNRVNHLTLDFFGSFGILLEGGGSGNQFTANTVDRPNTIGIGLYGTATASSGNVISGNRVTSAYSVNIALRYGTFTGTLIQDNTADQVDTIDQWGASIAIGSRYTSGEGDFRGTVVRGNRMEGNFGGGVFASDTGRDTLIERNRVDNNYGLPAFESDGDRTLIRRNTAVSTAFAGSTNFGVTVGEHAEDNRVELNTLDRVGGLDIEDRGTRSVISGNVMVGQIFPAPLITGAIGGIIIREEASRGRILANVVRRHSPISDLGGGIVVAGDGFTVAGNLVSEVDSQDGIRVEPQAAGTVLTANVSNQNGRRRRRRQPGHHRHRKRGQRQRRPRHRGRARRHRRRRQPGQRQRQPGPVRGGAVLLG